MCQRQELKQTTFLEEISAEYILSKTNLNTLNSLQFFLNSTTLPSVFLCLTVSFCLSLPLYPHTESTLTRFWMSQLAEDWPIVIVATALQIIFCRQHNSINRNHKTNLKVEGCFSLLHLMLKSWIDSPQLELDSPQLELPVAMLLYIIYQTWLLKKHSTIQTLHHTRHNNDNTKGTTLV